MDERIRKVLDHVEDHLFLKLSLKDLAEIACMSTGHFHKAFKKETGRTPFKFIEEIKMNKAFQLLISGSSKVHELALNYGYSDYETFSRSFKKHHAIAPDDLKAISQKIQDKMEVGPESLIIKTFEVQEMHEVKDLMDQLANKLSQLLSEKGLSEDDLRNSKLLSAIPKSSGINNDANIVRNKFEITENPKIWKELLKNSKDGNS